MPIRHDAGAIPDPSMRRVARLLLLLSLAVYGCLRRSLLIGRLHLRDRGRKPRGPPRYT